MFLRYREFWPISVCFLPEGSHNVDQSLHARLSERGIACGRGLGSKGRLIFDASNWTMGVECSSEAVHAYMLSCTCNARLSAVLPRGLFALSPAPSGGCTAVVVRPGTAPIDARYMDGSDLPGTPMHTVEARLCVRGGRVLMTFVGSEDLHPVALRPPRVCKADLGSWRFISPHLWSRGRCTAQAW